MPRTILALALLPALVALAGASWILEAVVVPYLRAGHRLGSVDAIVEQAGALGGGPPVPCRLIVLGSSQSREAFDGVAIGEATGCDVWNFAYSSATPVSDAALFGLVLDARPTHVLEGYSAFSLSRCFDLPPFTLEIMGAPAAAAVAEGRRAPTVRADLELALVGRGDALSRWARASALRSELWPALLAPPAPPNPALRPGASTIRLRDPWIYVRTLPLAEIEAGVRADNPLAAAFTRPDCLAPDAPGSPSAPAHAVAAMRAWAALRGVRFATARLPVHPATAHFIRPEHEADLARVRAAWPAADDLDWTDPELTATLIDSTHVGAAGRALITARTAAWLGSMRAVP